jgi:plastocyanin
MGAIKADLETLASDMEAMAVAASKVRVAIVKAADGYHVRPASVVVSRGTRVRFVNLTTQPVDVFVPDRELFGEQVLHVAGGDVRELDLRQTSVPARYPYAVFSHAARDFVAGASAPEIIVDP